MGGVQLASGGEFIGRKYTADWQLWPRGLQGIGPSMKSLKGSRAINFGST
ncbi:Hypothetical protein BFG00_0771 [Corynebacterium pseudotuberculosis]|nr:Hypothetical protein BFF96_0773 [Corynebacterium pseudotuberculosis]AUY60159.1 Hypothetical protein BFG00_0771 [Corynebacterium pseudotuberculosis]